MHTIDMKTYLNTSTLWLEFFN